MARRILVFADGTGNAFTRGESNIWRLYQSLDRSNLDQLIFYIPGVGTSGFKPLAMLDGATGLGVPSNVRKLYRFLCWNWAPGAEIHLFGFSRGAFTVRALVGLIESEGLIPALIDGKTVSHAEMGRNAMSAWRSYRARKVPTGRIWTSSPLVWLARGVRDFFLLLWRRVLHPHWRTYAQVKNARTADRIRPPIRFMGLFDTVEAYGVPFEEMRRAINWGFWPITFRNRVLYDGVAQACHALSLDDERTTFHPIRFDRSSPKDRERIAEVWFAGVHADVGGGYPEAGLALIALAWMAEAAERAGVRFRAGAVQAFASRATPYGALHDSRAGLATVYRYGPREIGCAREDGGPPLMHHTVAEKMAFGSDNYAPVTLPESALALMPDGSTRPIGGLAQQTMLGPPSRDTARAEQALAQLGSPRPELVEATRCAIRTRRILYFLLLGSAATCLAFPWLAPLLTGVGGLTEGERNLGGVAHSLVRAVEGMLPGWAAIYADALADHVFLGVAAITVLVVLYRLSGQYRDKIFDLSRGAWGLGGGPATKQALVRARRGGLTPGRMAPVARAIRHAFGRYIAPGVIVVGLLAALFVVVSRTTFHIQSSAGRVCTSSGDAAPVLEAVSGPGGGLFSTSDLCFATGFALEMGRRYAIEIRIVDPWLDRTTPSDVAGVRAISLPRLVGAPLRRWFSADYFRPVLRVGSTGDHEWPIAPINGDRTWSATRDKSGFAMASAPDGPRNVLVSEFTAPASGELFLFVNDAVAAVPFLAPFRGFYQNNHGTARIRLRRLPLPDFGADVQPRP